MAELTNIRTVLNKLAPFNPLQRLVLAHPGTLQGALSVYFGRELVVEVVRQDQDPNQIIRRLSRLHDHNVVVCEASSQLTIERADVRAQVLAQTPTGQGASVTPRGLGRILEDLEVRPAFQLDLVGEQGEFFWRFYTLRAPGLTFAIRETFPQVLFRLAQAPPGVV